MSQIITKPATKIKTGIKSAISNPARFIVSLAIGFGMGVIMDIILEYIAMKVYTPLQNSLEIGFPFYYKFPERTSIPYDDVIMIGATIFLLFIKRFVTTLGFFLGWYISSNEQLASKLGLYEVTLP